MTDSPTERVFARMCVDPAYAEAVARGEIDQPDLTDEERDALMHDAGTLTAETTGFTAQFKVEQHGFTRSWVKPCPSHFHGSDFNASRIDQSRPSTP